MHRFWTRYSKPLIEALVPQSIMEIGAGTGANSRHLLEYCERTGARIDIIEPMVSPALREVVESFSGVDCSLHEESGAAVIAGLDTPDLALLTGDPNWRTVFTELSMLSTRASIQGRLMPMVLVHACGWPYARRDMYREPTKLREERRPAFAYKGMLPGVSELVEDGINSHYANAVIEGGPENGVLTAIEDFVAVTPGIRLWRLPFMGGIGILCPEERLSKGVETTIEQFFSPTALMEVCEALERSTNQARAELATQRRALAQCSESLGNAKQRFTMTSIRREQFQNDPNQQN